MESVTFLFLLRDWPPYKKWNLIIPYFSKVRYCILIAIFVSILCGFDDSIGYYLSLSRTITFSPYFLMGYFCEKSHIDIIKKYIRKKYAI